MDDIKAITEEQLQKLPPEVADAIGSIPWRERVGQIAAIHLLSEEETAALEVEVGIVVLGIEPSDQFPENVSENIGLSNEIVEKITEEIDEQIIKPILDLVDHPKTAPRTTKKVLPVETSASEPIVITHETKQEALQELGRREEVVKKKASVSATPEVAPHNLPMVEKGEAVHDVPHVEVKETPKSVFEPVKTVPLNEIKPEKPPQVGIPDYRYPGGKDPYREPMQ